ncbi:DUF2497 domain-containing protein [Sphingomonas quercus]|uniref:DUF2497 domain-containing protein n=1 Tax=Sphingomonas quercus TaxID=2842451 RepID=A0ABS6BGH1_9SPHN|nr:DUF2497 domain-containing protein [Sphingomonas quercus]MBU3076345.1 DUF2497 domain-containing protein [Sphingomonas quercus]
MGPDEQSIEDILASIRRVITEEEVAPEAEPDDELELTEPLDITAAPQPQAATAPAPRPAPALVSPGAADASRQALTYLSSLKLRSGDPADDTLHGLVRELLKPMLKAWLDAELPTLVERLVVQEIARLTADRS